MKTLDLLHRWTGGLIGILLSLPNSPGDLIALRMKQPEEWLPNGRTMLWFAPEDGRLSDPQRPHAMCRRKEPWSPR